MLRRRSRRGRIKDHARMNPAGRAGRNHRRRLDRRTAGRTWIVGAAVMAIFVEGSVKDRKEILAPAKPPSDDDIEAYVDAHPLVKHHGIARQHMDLIRAHQKVESGHRRDAYDMVIQHGSSRREQDEVLACLQHSLKLWLRYRDGIARACRLRRPSAGV